MRKMDKSFVIYEPTTKFRTPRMRSTEYDVTVNMAGAHWHVGINRFLKPTIKDEPIPDDVYWVEQPHMLWTPYWCSQMFGHLIIDNMIPTYRALEALGYSDEDKAKFKYMGQIDFFEQPQCRGLEHWLRGLVPTSPDDPVEEWEDWLPRLTQEAGPNRTICLRHMVAGLGNRATLGSGSQYGAGTDIWHFSEFMVKNFGIDPDVLPSRHQVTLMEKKPGGQAILNVTGLRTDLIAHYKNLNLDVKVVILPRLNDTETLQVLRNTTILVGPPGSLGLLSMFLPRGAVFQTIENPGYWPPDARLWHRNMGQFWGHIYSQYYNYTEKEKEQSGGLLGAEIDIMLDSENLAQHLDSALVRMTENSELPASEISEINLAEEELEM
jgi:hypothetical protein